MRKLPKEPVDTEDTEGGNLCLGYLAFIDFYTQKKDISGLKSVY